MKIKFNHFGEMELETKIRSIFDTNIAEQIAKDLESEGNIVLGSTFMDDLTEIYKRDYSDLISEFDGEEICPNCNHTNSFTCCGTNRRITCENCGEEILLCSICNREVDCSECPY